jgi:hypothetical protein
VTAVLRLDCRKVKVRTGNGSNNANSKVRRWMQIGERFEVSDGLSIYI